MIDIRGDDFLRACARRAKIHQFKGGAVAGNRLQRSVPVCVRMDICLELEPNFRVRLQRNGAAGAKGSTPAVAQSLR